jgi:hypothetical protein
LKFVYFSAEICRRHQFLGSIGREIGTSDASFRCGVQYICRRAGESGASPSTPVAAAPVRRSASGQRRAAPGDLRTRTAPDEYIYNSGGIRSLQEFYAIKLNYNGIKTAS